VSELDQGLDIRFYLGALRRRFLVMLLAFVVVAGGAVAASVLLPPVFKSEAKIIVESQQIPADLVRSTVTGFASERLQVIQQRITTREVMLGLVEKFGLFAEGGQKLSPSDLVDLMRNSIAIEQFDLGTNRGRGGGLAIGFTVGFQHRDPQVATRVANELVTLILAEDIKSRTARASETTRFIEREFEQRRKELAAVEAQISAYKLENDRALPEKLSYLMAQAERARGQLASLEREIQNNEEQARLLELELSIRQANSGSNDASGFTRTAALQQVETLSAELTRKRSVYTDSHPDVKA
jgi:polysaccharide biosynthesis transport protein